MKNKRNFLLVLLGIIIIFAVSIVSGIFGSYPFYTPITINESVSVNFSNFPFVLNQTYLNMSYYGDFAVVFNDTFALPCEFVNNSDYSQGRDEIWCSNSTLNLSTNADNPLRMYFRKSGNAVGSNSTDVWRDYLPYPYDFVLHLNDNSSNISIDSNQNMNWTINGTFNLSHDCVFGRCLQEFNQDALRTNLNLNMSIINIGLNNNGTLMFWFKANTSNGNTNLGGRGVTGSTSRWLLTLNSTGNLNWDINDVVGGFAGNITYNNNIWHFIAMRWNNHVGTDIIIDGLTIVSTIQLPSDSPGFPCNSFQLCPDYIGYSYHTFSQYQNLSLDEVRFTRKYLTNAELNQTYIEGKKNYARFASEIGITFPIVTLLNPTNGYNLSSSPVNLNCSMNDTNPQNLTVYVWNSTNYLIFSASNITAGATNLSTFATLPDGFFNWSCLGITTANNHNSSENWSFTLDSTVPSMNLTYPLSLNYSYNITQLNFTISDIHLQSCWYSTNQTTNVTITCGNNVTGITSVEGYNTWYIYANDSLGNVNSSSITFFKDTIFPQIQFVAPTQSDGKNTTNNYIIANVSINETNFANITFVLFNLTSIVNQTNYTTLNSLINWSGLPNADYKYNVTITDTVGNKNSTPTYNIRLDSTAPNATLLIPSNGTYTNTLLNNLTVNLTDNLGISNATIFVYNSSNYLINQTTTNFGSNVISSAIGVVLSLVDNAYNWFYQVLDWSGNSYITGNNTLIVDTIKPQIQFVSPTTSPGAYNQNYILANVSTNDTNFANFTIYLYNSSYSLINYTFNSTSSIAYANYSNLSDDIYYLNATATDLANNRNSTETRVISLGTVPPVVTLNNPISSKNITSGNNLLFNFTASSLANITRCDLYGNWTGSFILNQSISNVNSSNQTNFNLINISNYGNYRWNVFCNNTLGNKAFASSNYTFKIYNSSMTISNLTNSTIRARFNNASFSTQVTTGQFSSINYCNFTAITSNSTIVLSNYQNNTPSGNAYSTPLIFLEDGSINFTIRCVNNEGDISESNQSLIVSPYALTTNPAINSTFKFGAIHYKNETNSFLISMYDNANMTLNYNVTYMIENSSDFTVAISSYNITLNSTDSSTNPVYINVSLNASNNIANGSYRGNITFTNFVYNFTYMINFVYSINPPSGIVSIFDTSGNACNMGNACKNNMQITVGTPKTFTYIINNTGLFGLTGCTPNFTNDLNGVSWVSFSNTSFDLGVGNSTTEVITFNPTSSDVGIYSDNFQVACSSMNVLGDPTQTLFNPINIVSVSQPGSPPGNGGGSETPGNVTINLAFNFSLVTSSYGDKADIVLAKGSIRPVTTELYLINKDINPVDINISCQNSNVITSNPNLSINICDYVSFDKDFFTASPNEVSNNPINMYVNVPENASFGDEYDFNVVATNNQKSKIFVSKLSVSARVTVWAEIFKQSPVPLQDTSLPNDKKLAYPAFFAGLIIAIIVFALTIFIFSRFKLTFTGVWVGFLLAIISFILSLLYLDRIF